MTIAISLSNVGFRRNPVSYLRRACDEVAATSEDTPSPHINRKHARVMARRYDRFGELSAELFQCESNQQNELEVSAETHILLMRHSGVASRCEIVWSDHGCSKRLSEVRENSILFAPARSRVRVTKKDSGCYGTIVLQIPPCALESLNDEHRDASRVTLAPQAGTGQPELCQVMSAMRDEIERPGPAGQLYKEALALQLLIRLLRSADQLAIAPAKGGLAAWQLRRTIDMLEGDLTSTPSLARLAAQVGLSPTHFCTAFRRSTGLPPHRYLLNRRIEHAKRLMADPERSLTEVALDSGFGSSSQFATAFRRADGRTPSAYRRGL